MEKKKIKAIVRLTGKEVIVTPEQDAANEFRTVYRSDSDNIYLLEELDMRVEPDADQPLSEQVAYDEYQERSKTSGDRAESLAWAMIVLLAGQLIGGSKYAEFYVLGGAGLLYLLLSAMQSVWQSVTIWLVKCNIKRTGITLNDYPDWVGFGAWVFYWLKMIIIAIGAIYGASRFITFAM